MPWYVDSYLIRLIHAFRLITLPFVVCFIVGFGCVLMLGSRIIICLNFILFCSCSRNLECRRRLRHRERCCGIECNGLINGRGCSCQFLASLLLLCNAFLSLLTLIFIAYLLVVEWSFILGLVGSCCKKTFMSYL